LGCINPKHLRWGTREENRRDAQEHGIVPKGEAINTAKLTEQQVLSIVDDKRIQTEIAKQYNISTRTIWSIKSGEKWGWLTGIKKERQHTVAPGKRASKLKESDVIEIRKMVRLGKTYNEIATQYGCNRRTVEMANTGRTWAWL
jgi:DNA-binding CsgD family transcriptional regulator